MFENLKTKVKSALVSEKAVGIGVTIVIVAALAVGAIYVKKAQDKDNAPR